MEFIKDLNVDKIRNLAEDAYNQAKPKTDLEARVYEVLSHKNWGASSTLMNEIARDTYDYDKFPTITRIMWESIENQRPAAWRVVFKGLTLLEHLIKNGSERCVDDARNHSHSLRSLHRFNYYEGTIDRGVGVREKSKQLVEILGDDERIREERTKARKMREKFGGGGGMQSVSGGGGSKYAGYGNDDSNWRSGGGGGGGYGDSGLGSTSGGGGYGDDKGYSGRYSDGGVDSSSAPAPSSSAPTFAALPEKSSKKEKSSEPKKLKKKKKKKPVADAEAAEPAPAAAPEVDLFDIGAPTPASAPAPAANDDEFDAFQTAGTSSSAAGDKFDAFGSGADPFAQQQPAQTQQQQPQFDAFGTQQPQQQMGGAMNSMNNAFGNMNMGQQQQQQQQGMHAMGGGGGMMGMQQMGGGNTNVASGGMANGSAAANQASATNDDDDDEFGDFGEATSPDKAAAKSADPLGGLINLDGLKKNEKKKEDNLNKPIVVNDAAAQYMQHQQQMSQAGQKSNISAEVSFRGIDGLNTMPTDFSPKGVPQSNRQPGQPVMVGAGGGGGGVGMGMIGGQVQDGGADAISTMFAPQTPQQQGRAGMVNQQQQQQQQQQMMMGMQGQQQGGNMMGGNMMPSQQMGGNMGGQQMGRGMMGGQQMGGGMMGGQQMGGGMMGGQQQMAGNMGQGNMMGGGGQQMNGGMMGNPQMMSGNMMGNQQQGGGMAGQGNMMGGGGMQGSGQMGGMGMGGQFQ